MLAFGTRNGYVGLRDLTSGKSHVRQVTATGVAVEGDAEFLDGGILRVCFLPGPVQHTRLLSVSRDIVQIWNPREVML